jgi:hypothetical protein
VTDNDFVAPNCRESTSATVLGSSVTEWMPVTPMPAADPAISWLRPIAVGRTTSTVSATTPEPPSSDVSRTGLAAIGNTRVTSLSVADADITPVFFSSVTTICGVGGIGREGPKVHV